MYLYWSNMLHNTIGESWFLALIGKHDFYKWELTKHIEQVKSISSLMMDSKISQVSDGLPSLNMRLQPSNAGAFSDLTLLSLELMRKAISSQSQGLWRISIRILWAWDLKVCPCLESWICDQHEVQIIQWKSTTDRMYFTLLKFPNNMYWRLVHNLYCQNLHL